MQSYAYDEDLMLKGIRDFQSDLRARDAAQRQSDEEDEDAWVSRLAERRQQRMHAVAERDAERARESHERTRLRREQTMKALIDERRFFSAALEVLCKSFGVPPYDVLGLNRERPVGRVRALFAKMLRTHTSLSFPQIGELMKRHHSSVIVAVAQADTMLAENPILQDQFDQLSIEALKAARRIHRRAA